MPLNDLNGILLVDKPKDCTSHDVVHRARKLLNMKSIGHSGTLDPLASGLMVLLIGEGTKLSDYILCENKRYRVRLQFGLTSDTLDRTGQISQGAVVNLSQEAIVQAMQQLLGDFEWPVPHFSAVKVGGKKLYEDARQEKRIEPPKRTMRFFDLNVNEVGADWADVDLSCSKGSYIRTWDDQVGQQLGCGAVLDQLRRLRSEPFSIEEAVDLEGLRERQQQDPGGFNEWLKASQRGYLPLARALPQMKSFFVLGQEERLLRNGQIARTMSGRLLPEVREALRSDRPTFVKAMNEDHELLALLELGREGIKVRRVFLDVN